MMGPCHGITVIDLTRYLPGRFCTLMLADLGAEVITVEPPRLPSAKMRPIGRDTGARYLALNRNKKSITLNLSSEEGKGIFYQLVRKADVLLEGSRPGAAERLEIDYGTLKEVNPKIIYVSISSFGQKGPYRELSSHDVNIMGLAGLLNVTGDVPSVTGIYLGDTVTAFTATVAALSALVHAQKTGQGQFIDISMLDALIGCLNVKAMRHFIGGDPGIEREDFASFTYPFYNAYRTKDGTFLTIGATEPHFWERFCIAMGKKEFIPHQFATGSKQEEIFNCFRETFASKTREEWISVLRQADIPCGPVNSMEEALQDPQVIYRDMVTEAAHPLLGTIKQLGVPIKFSGTTCSPPSTPPLYGQHTNEILEGLGFSKESIEEFRKKEVIE